MHTDPLELGAVDGAEHARVLGPHEHAVRGEHDAAAARHLLQRALLLAARVRVEVLHVDARRPAAADHQHAIAAVAVAVAVMLVIRLTSLRRVYWR